MSMQITHTMAVMAHGTMLIKGPGHRYEEELLEVALCIRLCEAQSCSTGYNQ